MRGACCRQALTLQPPPPLLPSPASSCPRSVVNQDELGLSTPLEDWVVLDAFPQTSLFFAFFLAEPRFSVGSPFFNVLEKMDTSAVFHCRAPLPLC